MPPLGRSKKEDFNPTVHLELESDEEIEEVKVEKPKGDDDGSEDATDNSEIDGDDEDAKDPEEPALYVPPTEEEMAAALQLKVF